MAAGLPGPVGGRGRARLPAPVRMPAPASLPGCSAAATRPTRPAAGRAGVVAAVDRDRRLAAILRPAVLGRCVLPPERAEVDRQPADGQLGESLLQARDAVLPPAVEADGDVLALAEDLADQAG